MTALSTRGLSKTYGEQAVVDGLDLTVERGELYGFLGPNGAGKTTTIRMALGLVRPTGGEVELLDAPVFSASGRRALERVGALVEEPGFYRFLSGRRNLEVFARAGGRGADTALRLSRLDEVLETVDLTAAAGKRVRAYSQGMRQRLGIAAALLGKPDVLVLDEPTNGLDPQGMREIRLLLRRLADAGTTVFISSHLLAEVEAMCDRVGVLAHGKLLAEGPPGSLRGAAERVRIEVNEADSAARVIAALDGAELMHEEGHVRSGVGVIRVHLAGTTTAAVNAALVSAGIQVSALTPERDSLEDVFLALVEGEDVPR
ncbi:MAG: ABC transporter ATP-binding protein [Actinomycetota bacterium]